MPRWITRAAGGWGLPGPNLRRPVLGAPAADFTRQRHAPWRSEVLQATIDDQGNAQLQTAPDGGAIWLPTEATVFCTTNPAYQVFVQVYRAGTAGVPTALLGSSFAGSGDTLGIGSKAIGAGDALVVQFSQGAPGSMVTVQFEGSQYVPAA